jgi:hypothetical protein
MGSFTMFTLVTFVGTAMAATTPGLGSEMGHELTELGLTKDDVESFSGESADEESGSGSLSGSEDDVAPNDENVDTPNNGTIDTPNDDNIDTPNDDNIDTPRRKQSKQYGIASVLIPICLIVTVLAIVYLSVQTKRNAHKQKFVAVSGASGKVSSV